MHQALYGADPHHRAWLCENLALMLSKGDAIPESARAWLAFVLSELHRTGRIPTRYVGRPAHSGIQVSRRAAVAEAFLQISRSRPGLTYDEMNDAIAKRLEHRGGPAVMSASRVKQLRETAGFADEVRLYREYLDRADGWDTKPPGPLLG